MQHKTHSSVSLPEGAIPAGENLAKDFKEVFNLKYIKAPKLKTSKKQLDISCLYIHKVHKLKESYGVFTTRFIQENVIVGVYTGLLTDCPDDQASYAWVVKDNVYCDSKKSGNILRFVNHSSDPNCSMIKIKEEICYQTLLPILPGEQLTIDYGMMYWHHIDIIPTTMRPDDNHEDDAAQFERVKNNYVTYSSHKRNQLISAMLHLCPGQEGSSNINSDISIHIPKLWHQYPNRCVFIQDKKTDVMTKTYITYFMFLCFRFEEKDRPAIDQLLNENHIRLNDKSINEFYPLRYLLYGTLHSEERESYILKLLAHKHIVYDLFAEKFHTILWDMVVLKKISLFKKAVLTLEELYHQPLEFVNKDNHLFNEIKLIEDKACIVDLGKKFGITEIVEDKDEKKDSVITHSQKLQKTTKRKAMSEPDVSDNDGCSEEDRTKKDFPPIKKIHYDSSFVEGGGGRGVESSLSPSHHEDKDSDEVNINEFKKKSEYSSSFFKAKEKTKQKLCFQKVHHELYDPKVSTEDLILLHIEMDKQLNLKLGENWEQDWQKIYNEFSSDLNLVTIGGFRGQKKLSPEEAFLFWKKRQVLFWLDSKMSPTSEQKTSARQSAPELSLTSSSSPLSWGTVTSISLPSVSNSSALSSVISTMSSSSLSSSSVTSTTSAHREAFVSPKVDTTVSTMISMPTGSTFSVTYLPLPAPLPAPATVPSQSLTTSVSSFVPAPAPQFVPYHASPFYYYPHGVPTHFYYHPSPAPCVTMPTLPFNQETGVRFRL